MGARSNSTGYLQMELTPLLNQKTEGRTSHRDERTLYVRFPPSLALRDKSFLEPLVPSAVDIRLPRLSATGTAKFCYMEFETEEEATRIKESMSNIKVEGEAFYADYVGKKSKTYPVKEPKVVDPLRLYVGGLPVGMHVKHLRAAFPTATQVLYKKASRKVTSSHAYLIFASHEDALRAFESSSDLKILAKKVIVMFATYKNITEKNEEQFTTRAKKQKTDVEMEEGSE
ncbi:nucleolin [Portunus trituberculatus]|uniref:Nucleolin n=1 Tax=Portunus trituberculatus TaxID=210409 RepID=A0A5B7DLX5_PORTR|nr:nucleolin [Portunus trituberculatus]